MKEANFLCEIGTEEIPAGYVPAAIDAAGRIFNDRLTGSRIGFGKIEVFATPRRFAVMISGLEERQKEEEVEVKGPSVASAYGSDGKPSRALQGFLAGNNVCQDDVFRKMTDKGEYIYARKRLEARNTAEIIPEIIRDVVNGIPFPKRMRWSSKNEITFARPIPYFLILFNGSVIPFEMDGVKSSDKTRGHFIQHDSMIGIKSVSEYRSVLAKNGVMVDQNERKSVIRKGLKEAAAKAGGRLNDDEELLDLVTYLVEDPHIVTCEFDRGYLRIPEIVLIAEMREHQKYFSVTGGDGRLTNKFLVVSNNPETPYVKAGNVRVISARFNDAGFFYDEDRKKKLADRVDQLKSVLFHKELGSIYDKVVRMTKVSDEFASLTGLNAATREKIKRAILLCKADLNTAIVFEFPSLQGRIGKIYAVSDGEDGDVADAIDEHYKPRSQNDTMPSGVVSIAVSVSEKIDNLFGSFSVGNIPKGSADPYALRRQANALVDMLIKNGINLDLRTLLERVSGNYRGGAGLVDKIHEFISARAKTIFADSGFSHDEIDACLSTERSDFLELWRLAKSVNEFRKNEKFTELLLGFKRMKNIVASFRKDNPDYALGFDPAGMEDDAERELYDFFHSKSGLIGSLISESKYIELFELIIQGKAAIDRFFDRVLVMDKRTAVRDNRLYILEYILKNFSGLLDFSKIADR